MSVEHEDDDDSWIQAMQRFNPADVAELSERATDISTPVGFMLWLRLSDVKDLLATRDATMMGDVTAGFKLTAFAYEILDIMERLYEQALREGWRPGE